MVQRHDYHRSPSINTLEAARTDIAFGTALANPRDELRNGRAEMIRATGAVLIASVLSILSAEINSTFITHK